jgi:hypothetical protein
MRNDLAVDGSVAICTLRLAPGNAVGVFLDVLKLNIRQ